LTSAINGFGLAATDAMAISDKFAALGANSASSYEEMAIALSKVAPVAKTAGVGIDTMMAFLAKGIETTREAPENIGTAFKTIFARMTQLRDFGKTLEEGVGVNTVEDALATAGIALRDSQGVFRDMDEVLTELGYKFDSLSRNQQSYIATALAGTRQQSRLLAVMQNFDRTMELVEVSTESAGATLAQHAKYAGGMEAANARLQTSFQQIIVSLVNSEVVIGIINIMAGALESLSHVAGALAFAVLGLATVFGIYKLVQAAATIQAAITTWVMSGLATANTAVGITAGIAAAKTMTLGVAIAISTGGLILIVAAVVALVMALKNMKNSTEKSTEKIKELQVELYNINKETKDLTALVDQFEELDKKVFKTAEDMKEMESILSKIDEYGGSEFDFVLAGKLDKAAIDLFLQAQEESRKTKLEEMRTEGEGNLKRMLNGVEQTAETRASIMEFIASTVQGFDDMDKDLQNQIRFAISRDLEGYAKAFSIEFLGSDQGNSYAESIANQYGDRGAQMPLTVSFNTDATVMKPEVLKLLKEFKGLFTGELKGQDALDMFGLLFTLNPQDRKMIEDAYSNELEGILQLGKDVIDGFLSEGYSLNQVNQMVQQIQNALTGLEKTSIAFHGTSQGAVSYDKITDIGGEVASKFAQGMSGVASGDLVARNQVIDDTIEYLKNLEYHSGTAEEAIAALINAVTDPMAFQNAMNIFKSTADTVTSLIDASEAYQEGKIDDKLLSLITDYPELAEDIRKGTLDMAQSIEIMVAKNISEINRKISDLQYQLSLEEIGSDMAQVLEAQIATLKDMIEKESFLYGGIAEEFKVRETDKVSDRFKTQIDFIKKYNDEQQKEIDLMQKKLDMNKSMLQLDRQIAALATDTSYGAQARSRDLQEQQRSAAVEREKLVMDLVTEQAISELEKERDKNIADIAANVAKIVEEMKKGTLGSNPFEADSALTFGG
jgi:TP901 family phage tail tape measure protein